MARLDDYTINELKRLDIRDLADRLGIELGRANTNARCFNTEAHKHGDRNASLGFNKRTNTFKCFACDISGDTIALVMAVKGLDFRSACEWLANTYAIQLKDEPKQQVSPSKPDYSRKGPYTDHNEPLRLSKEILDYSTPHQKIYQALYNLSDEPNDELKKWWSKRGFSPSLLKTYGWRVISPATVKKLLKTYNYPTLAKTGLVGDDMAELEHFLRRYNSHNVIVPFYNEDLFNRRSVLYVRFRSLRPDAKQKYLAPKGSSSVIYAYDSLCRWAMSYPTTPPLYITESETDAIAVTELARRQNKEIYAVALTGGQKSEHSLVVRELIEAVKTVDKGATINIVTDRDRTGERFYNTLATALYNAGFSPANLIKWQEWHESLKDVGDHLQKLTEQANGLHPNNNLSKEELKR